MVSKGDRLGLGECAGVWYGNAIKLGCDDCDDHYTTINVINSLSSKKKKKKTTCIPVFIAALFTIGNTWKQFKCPLTDKWIKNMWLEFLLWRSRNESD